MCVGVGGGVEEGENGRARVGERKRERERETSGLSQSVRGFSGFWGVFSPLILFHVMGLVLRSRNGTTEKNTLLLS